MPDDLNVLLEQLALELDELYGERYRDMVLYGSYARGEADEGSDVDVLLLLEGEVNSTRELLRTEDVEWPLSLHPVSVEAYQSSEQPFATHAKRASGSLDPGRSVI